MKNNLITSPDTEIESEIGCISLMQIIIKQSEKKRKQKIIRINELFDKIHLKFFENGKVDVGIDDYINLKTLCKELGYVWVSFQP